MSVLAIGSSVMFAAAGYSLLYLLMGGELGGAILIFIVAKMLGRRRSETRVLTGRERAAGQGD